MKKLISILLSLAIILSVVGVVSITSSATTITPDSSLLTDTTDFDQGLSSIALSEKMITGYNIGNLFEMTELRQNYTRPTFDNIQDHIKYKETFGGNVEVTENYIKYLAESGVDAIRLPVTWFNMLEYTGELNGKTYNGEIVDKSVYYANIDERRKFWYNGVINEEFMDRVQQVVDWIIKYGMYCIINTHHDGACNNANAVNPEKFGNATAGTSGETYNHQTITYLNNIWGQVGERFKNYGSRLLFEPYNEVADETGSMTGSATRSGYAAEVAAAFIQQIRAQGGNNDKRFLVIPNYGGISFMTNADALATVKAADTVNDVYNDKIILTSHFYGSSMQDACNSIKNIKTNYNMGATLDEIGLSGKSAHSSAEVTAMQDLYTYSHQYNTSCFFWDNGEADYSITNRYYNTPSSAAFEKFVGKEVTYTSLTQSEILSLTSASQPNWMKLYSEDSNSTWGGKYLIITSEKPITSLTASSSGQGYYLINGADDGLLTQFVSDDGVNYEMLNTVIPTAWTSTAWSQFKAIATTYYAEQVDGNYFLDKIGDGLQKYVTTGDELIAKYGGELRNGGYDYSSGNYVSTAGNRICYTNKIDVTPNEYYYFNCSTNSRYNLLIRGYDANGNRVCNVTSVSKTAKVKMPSNVYKISVTIHDSYNSLSYDSIYALVDDGTIAPEMYHYVSPENLPTAPSVNRIVAFGDSVMYGDSNSGYGSGNKFGEEHFLNLLGKEYSLNRITKASDATADGKWFINLAKCGYTIGDKNYWETTRAPSTYNGTIYEDEVMTCDPSILANADTVVMDGGVNDFCRLAGWLASASYSGTYTGSEKTAAYNIAPGETKTISNMTADEAQAYANKYKNLKGTAFEEFKTTYESQLTSAIRSWEEFRNIEIQYLTNIVTYLEQNGFEGTIVFMDNPNSFIGKNTGLGVFWDEMVSYCQSEPMELVANEYSNVYHAKVTENVRDAAKYMSSSTDYLHLSFLGNREIYKVISKTINPNANTIVFEDNTLPENASWKTLYDFESYDINNSTFKYITGGTIKSVSDINTTINNTNANTTKVLYKPSSEKYISISKSALPANTYGIRVRGFTEGTSSFVSVNVLSQQRNLSKTSRTNTSRWGEFTFLPGYTSGNCATSSVSGLGTLINISDMTGINEIKISSFLNSSQEPCYVESIEVYTTDDVVVDNESGEPVTNPTEPTEPSSTDPTEPSSEPQYQEGDYVAQSSLVDGQKYYMIMPSSSTEGKAGKGMMVGNTIVNDNNVGTTLNSVVVNEYNTASINTVAKAFNALESFTMVNDYTAYLWTAEKNTVGGVDYWAFKDVNGKYLCAPITKGIAGWNPISVVDTKTDDCLFNLGEFRTGHTGEYSGNNTFKPKTKNSNAFLRAMNSGAICCKADGDSYQAFVAFYKPATSTNPTEPTEPSSTDPTEPSSTEPTEPSTEPIDLSLEMTTNEGASIRLNNHTGLRFYTEVDKDKVTQLRNAGYTVQLGTLIAPADYVDGNELTFDLGIGRFVDVQYVANEYFSQGSFSGIVGSITNIKETTTSNPATGNILRDFVARGYAKITDSQNQTTIVYADYTPSSARSLGYVAYMFRANNWNNDIYLSNKTNVDRWALAYEDDFDPSGADKW